MSRAEHYHDNRFSTWLSSLHLEEPAAAIIGGLFALFFIFSVIWVFFDARTRQKSGCIAMLLILFFGWPLSFIWWFWLRPPVERAQARMPRRKA